MGIPITTTLRTTFIPFVPEEPELYFRDSEEYALQAPITEFPLSCTNVPWDGKPTPAEEFVKPDYSGLRIYDPAIGCYVLKPKPPLPRIRRPRPSPSVYNSGTGDWYWITCRETGVDLRKFRAQTAAAAQTAAGLYALSNKLPADAAYARPAHD